jgi:hypothetical protein
MIKNKSILFWKVSFFLYLIITISETALFLIMFFMFPNNPISEFPSLMALPAKYLIMIVLGGFGKNMLMGYFLCYSFYEWKRLKNEANKIIS